MAYFSNGMENEDYKKLYCYHCIHFSDNPEADECPIMFLHWIYNYDECNKKDSFLHVLIPRNGIVNEKCTMFIQREE